MTLDAHLKPTIPEAGSEGGLTATADDIAELEVGVPFILGLDFQSAAQDIHVYVPDFNIPCDQRHLQGISKRSQHQSTRAAQRTETKEGADAVPEYVDDDDDDDDDDGPLPADSSDTESIGSDNDDDDIRLVGDSDLMSMQVNTQPRAKSKDESQVRAGCWRELLPMIEDVQLKTVGAHKFECECCPVADGSAPQTLTEDLGLWRCSDCRISHMCTLCHYTVHVARKNGGVFHRYSRWNWQDQAWESDATSLGSPRILAPAFFHVSGCNQTCSLRCTDVRVIQLGTHCTLILIT